MAATNATNAIARPIDQPPVLLRLVRVVMTSKPAGARACDDPIGQGEHQHRGDDDLRDRPQRPEPMVDLDGCEEVVGDLAGNHTRLKTCADWQEVNRKGIIYYLDGDKVRGVMLCNVWGKVDEARRWILKGSSIQEHFVAGTSARSEI